MGSVPNGTDSSVAPWKKVTEKRSFIGTCLCDQTTLFERLPVARICHRHTASTSADPRSMPTDASSVPKWLRPDVRENPATRISRLDRPDIAPVALRPPFRFMGLTGADP